MPTLPDDAFAPLLVDLNEPQRQAITHADGPLLILAGPGSGKTRVVTRRAAYLASTVTSARHVLAITFTNKAAVEMRQRVAALDVGPGITVATFHALCAKLLRIHHERAGITRNFAIYDRDDKRKAIKQAIEECGLSADNLSPASVDEQISLAKNALCGAAQYAESASDWRARMVARVFERYEALLTANSALDFDDLLTRMTLLVERDAELRGRLNDQYRYVLVDEYQDTNAAQYRLARLLSEGHRNLCVTGDPDQSIYGWRGADIRNILDFERDFPDAKVVRLEQNYRSTKQILALADKLIQNNLQRKHKALWTENTSGENVRIVELDDSDREASWIVDDIAKKVTAGAKLSDIAVFYRVNALSRVVEEAFFQKGLPYQIARGVEFYARKEVKDVLAYLRVLSNPDDELSLMRIINTPPRGIGDTTIERLKAEAQRTDRRVINVLSDKSVVSGLGRSGMKTRAFDALLMELSPHLNLSPSRALTEIISRSGLRAMYAQEDRGGDSAPVENLDELINAAAAFEESHPGASIVDWLEHAALVSDVDSVEGEKDCVTLMTLHAAKGLEFPIVYIVGLENGLLPFRRMQDDAGAGYDEEEERRLFFVGITRARRQLTLTRANYRMLRGITTRTTFSPFLDELPPNALQWIESERVATPVRSSRIDRGELPSDVDQWSVGTMVRHPLLGIGQIVSMDRGSRRTFVDVVFKDGSRKTWVLEFADLTRVEFEDVD
ncbi:MAG: UvrD-helicase domain-containing protein [Planctomycetes bacterium]|nr:UvrD-helicase domain-containing protein [Planctomycetota bacterium]MBI3834895.1 UvrD-helicase domain-containing protein [Planctomycetota bacterium]